MSPKINNLSAQKFNEHWENLTGLDYKSIESNNSDLDESLYPFLGPEALYTSFADYQELFSKLPLEVVHVCDLGAGVGRLAPIWKSIRENGSVSLVELVESRMLASKSVCEKLNLTDIYFYQNDLLKVSIPKANAYFIYLPVSKVLEKIIDELRSFGESVYIVSIESHGNLFERFENVRELELIEKVELSSERHNPYGHIYKFTPVIKDLNLFDQCLSGSYQDKVIKIREKNGEWIGLSLDLVWSSKNEILLKYPPRTIESHLVVSVDDLSTYSAEIQKALLMMKNGAHYQGSLIRKIWTHPELKIELLSGSIIPFENEKFI